MDESISCFKRSARCHCLYSAGMTQGIRKQLVMSIDGSRGSLIGGASGACVHQANLLI